MTYDIANIMKSAHRAAKKMIATGQWDEVPYREVFAFYLRQKWTTAQHEMGAARCTGATVTVARAFDNGNSPLWRL